MSTTPQHHPGDSTRWKEWCLKVVVWTGAAIAGILWGVLLAHLIFAVVRWLWGK